MYQLPESFKWQVVGHPPFSPDKVLTDYHLLLIMKTFLTTQKSDSGGEVKEAVENWLKQQAPYFYYEGIQKQVPRYGKCLNVGSDNVNK